MKLSYSFHTFEAWKKKDNSKRGGSMRWNKKYVYNKITDMKKKGLEGGKHTHKKYVVRTIHNYNLLFWRRPKEDKKEEGRKETCNFVSKQGFKILSIATSHSHL